MRPRSTWLHSRSRRDSHQRNRAREPFMMVQSYRHWESGVPVHWLSIGKNFLVYELPYGPLYQQLIIIQ